MTGSFLHDFGGMYLNALLVTLRISAWGILIAFVIGFTASLIQYYKIPVVRQIFAVYIELSRNTPLLIQLFFLYYGLPKLGIVLDREVTAIIGIAFLGGSYMAEAFRSSLESIDSAQIQSALSLGMTPSQVFFHVLFPQAMAISVPPLVANVIFLIKESSVVSAIALADLMYVAKDLIGLYYNTGEALLMLVICYLIILLPVSILGSIIERRLRYAGFGI
ncbi:MAG: amino acid ABC transporter permease [Lachnospiraceae bacterium]|nr:amino acid ABC transporter permease [Lachnospiraceae bacterium]